MIFEQTFETGVMIWLLDLSLLTWESAPKLPKGVFRALGGPKTRDDNSGRRWVESEKLDSSMISYGYQNIGERFKFAFLQRYLRYINLPERLSRTLVGPIFGERFKIAI